MIVISFDFYRFDYRMNLILTLNAIKSQNQ